ncbi:type II secretion system minor pseudopilin GspK [Ferrimonas balearica]|uniref:type II secretion system minor pseudopilin GspK n=1 Tax=Ferrimonas balearica TaxID=44012 RepID=UPI001C9A1597|nr:type II secretion system minor pseudopilin GspK [Ferrimonas balearica]MBY5994005.1 type II secretion system minor pseudopilin GspK [Ferrimonas balearica]
MRRQQSGMALLTVLLVLAVITTLAAGMTQRSQLSVRRTTNMAAFDQAYWYALSSEALAKRVLKQDFEDADGTTHMQQYWATANVVYPVERGQIAGQIDDMRSCFNLNALSRGLTQEEQNKDPYQKPLAGRQFMAMLEAMEIDNYWAELLADRVRDFTDADDRQDGSFGAEDAEYASRPIPYMTPNQLMIHHSELRAVLGTNQQLYRALRDYVCAIPGDDSQQLNVNTLPVERAALLVGMLEGKLSLSEAESLIQARPGDGWEDTQSFWEEPTMQRLQVDAQTKSTLVVDSQYFRLRGAAKVDNAVFRLESVMRRGGNDSLTVLTRQYGGQQ